MSNPYRSSLPTHNETKAIDTQDSLRAQVLARAGASPEKIAEMLAGAINKLQAQLEAKVTKHFAHQGEVIDTREYADNATQQGAADKLAQLAIQLAGLKAAQKEGPRKVDSIHISYGVPAARPEPKDVSPK